MKISALKLVLQNFEDALRLSGSKGADELHEFQSLLTSQKDGPVTQLIAALRKHLASQDSASSEPIVRLQRQLHSLSGVLASAGAKASANEISKVADALAGQFATVRDLVDYVQNQNEAPLAQNLASALRQDLVQSYLQTLLKSKSDNTEFDQNISLLREDKRIRTEEMREIAKLFLGFEIAKKKGRGPALQEIINHQALDARQMARSR
jgi:uncharacterized membrane protein YgaE (UPF0421/DUF939 family)